LSPPHEEPRDQQASLSWIQVVLSFPLILFFPIHSLFSHLIFICYLTFIFFFNSFFIFTFNIYMLFNNYSTLQIYAATRGVSFKHIYIPLPYPRQRAGNPPSSL
jgi:hypothetical protein